MLQHTPHGLLATDRQSTEGTNGTPETAGKLETRYRIDVTPRLATILHRAALTARGHAPAGEVSYVYDAARGNLNTVDVARAALVVRRATLTVRTDWARYFANLATEATRQPMPVKRARLHRARELADVIVVAESYAADPDTAKAERLIKEGKELMAALEEEIESIAAAHSLIA